LSSKAGSLDINIDIRMDLSLCGAEIAWKAVNGEQPESPLRSAESPLRSAESPLRSAESPLRSAEPWFLKHIRDRDLWRWDEPDCHPCSKAFGSAFFAQGIFVDTLIGLATYNEYQQKLFYEYGERLIAIDDAIINRLSGKADRAILMVPMGGAEPMPVYVMAVNTPLMQSEVGNALVKRQQEWYAGALDKWARANANEDGDAAPCAVQVPQKIEVALIYRYSLEEQCWWVSLRSDNKLGPNVASIAEKFGGGGHPAAAGFSYQGHIGDILKYNGPKKSAPDERP
jgi:hypothetical protein